MEQGGNFSVILDREKKKTPTKVLISTKILQNKTPTNTHRKPQSKASPMINKSPFPC